MSDNQISPAAFASPVSGALEVPDQPILGPGRIEYPAIPVDARAELKVRQMDYSHLCEFALTLAHGLTRNSDNTLVYVPKIDDISIVDMEEMSGMYRQENSPLVTLAVSLSDEGTLGHAILFNQGLINGLKVSKAKDEQIIDTLQECLETTQYDLRQANDLVCAMKREMLSNTKEIAAREAIKLDTATDNNAHVQGLMTVIKDLHDQVRVMKEDRATTTQVEGDAAFACILAKEQDADENAKIMRAQAAANANGDSRAMTVAAEKETAEKTVVARKTRFAQLSSLHQSAMTTVEDHNRAAGAGRYVVDQKVESTTNRLTRDAATGSLVNVTSFTQATLQGKNMGDTSHTKVTTTTSHGAPTESDIAQLRERLEQGQQNIHCALTSADFAAHETQVEW